jgi:hypothetical protein
MKSDINTRRDMINRDPKKIRFYGVAILFILAGAVIFTSGSVMWMFNYFGNSSFSVPSTKIIGGLVILALGYIVLELELLRHNSSLT